jgi:hypothetical protein
MLPTFSGLKRRESDMAVVGVCLIRWWGSRRVFEDWKEVEVWGCSHFVAAWLSRPRARYIYTRYPVRYFGEYLDSPAKIGRCRKLPRFTTKKR